MNDKIMQLIEEKSPEIANRLQIATEQVYGKILWYVRVDGLKNILTFIICLIEVWILIKLSRIVIKKLREYNHIEAESIYFFVLPIAIFFPIFLFFLTSEFLDQIMKVIYPEYWIINQLISSLTK